MDHHTPHLCREGLLHIFLHPPQEKGLDGLVERGQGARIPLPIEVIKLLPGREPAVDNTQ